MEVTREELENRYRDKETVELVELSLDNLTLLEKELLNQELSRRTPSKGEPLEVPWEIKLCYATFALYAFIRFYMFYVSYHEGMIYTFTSMVLKIGIGAVYLTSIKHMSKPKATTFYFVLGLAFAIPGFAFSGYIEFLMANPELIITENLVITIGQLIPIVGGFFLLKPSIRKYYGITKNNT
jgi:hypothetical protein